MVWNFAVLPVPVPYVPYLQIVRSVGLGSIMPNTAIRTLCDKPRPVPSLPPFTIRLSLPRSSKETRHISPQTRLIAAVRAWMPVCVWIKQKRASIRYPLFMLLYMTTTNIRRYLTPTRLLVVSCPSKIPLT